MNLDAIFQLEAGDPMVATNPLLLGGCVLAAIALGWLCVHRYANTNDIQKSIRLYIPLAAVNLAVFWLLGVPLLYGVGGQLCGFVVMTWISNHYFYH